MSTDSRENGQASSAQRGSRGEPVISVRSVGKRYDIYARNLDRLKDLVTGWRGRGRSRARPFWALRDINFDVYPGEAVGIIGRNGSGKSTLMQIIAGTLTPTTGEVRVRGRIAALLELGSGFNPQFTGRENVFLAGAILGFSRREMEAKFDAIAEFAEIGEFLDQPIEVYSSGMHARLAFAVAISVEPEVLILDEILSVGDAGFQQKCIARLQTMLDSGITLLFVSHAPDAVKSICSSGLFLKQGQQEFFGSSEDAVDRYMQFIRESTTARGLAAQPALAEIRPALPSTSLSGDVGVTSRTRYGTGHGIITSVRVLDHLDRPAQGFAFGDEVTIEAAIAARIDLDRLDVFVVIRDATGVDVIGAAAWDEGASIEALRASQEAVVRFTFAHTLKPGAYGVCLTFARRPDRPGEGFITLDHLDACATFEAQAPHRRAIRGKVQVPMRASVRVLEPKLEERGVVPTG